MNVQGRLEARKGWVSLGGLVNIPSELGIKSRSKFSWCNTATAVGCQMPAQTVQPVCADYRRLLAACLTIYRLRNERPLFWFRSIKIVVKRTILHVEQNLFLQQSTFAQFTTLRSEFWGVIRNGGSHKRTTGTTDLGQKSIREARRQLVYGSYGIHARSSTVFYRHGLCSYILTTPTNDCRACHLLPFPRMR